MGTKTFSFLSVGCILHTSDIFLHASSGLFLMNLTQKECFGFTMSAQAHSLLVKMLLDLEIDVIMMCAIVLIILKKVLKLKLIISVKRIRIV